MKGSVVHRQGWGEAQHFVKHDMDIMHPVFIYKFTQQEERLGYPGHPSFNHLIGP